MFFDWIIFILRRKYEDCRQAPFGTSHKKVIISYLFPSDRIFN